jgi:hypothetical protein
LENFTLNFLDQAWRNGQMHFAKEDYFKI